MKNLFKIVLTLLLVLSMAFGATSCDLLLEYGIGADADVGTDSDDTDKNDDNATADDTSKDDSEADESGKEPAPCKHKITKIINATESTCIDMGYTGDRVCGDCGVLIIKGMNIQKSQHSYVGGSCSVCGESDGGGAPDDGGNTDDGACKHLQTTLKNAVDATCTKEGYTGDHVCNECNEVVIVGITIQITKHRYSEGTCTVCGDIDEDYIPGETPEIFDGGILYLPNEADPITSDPYTNVNKTQFYANYTPAISYMDAYYRTKHNLMSGSIDPQDPTPSISAYQPSLDGMLVRNTTYLFSEDGNTYYVVNAYGEIVNRIFKGGAYVTLEEVAAYVFAFGTYPANHTTSKSTKPSSSAWGEYLRLNHSKFTGDTVKYPYEPELPNISGCGGDLTYYEMDIGTTGTDTGGGYAVAVYNNGTTITRGAARIVYARYDLDGDGVIEVGETYLFYTQNHYNDFREYLNYEGGWGVIFGNETGGGTLSSKYNYNPTPYVRTAYYSFVYADGSPVVKVEAVVVLCLPKREEV